jgi:hypothetical protein
MPYFDAKEARDCGDKVRIIVLVGCGGDWDNAALFSWRTV